MECPGARAQCFPVLLSHPHRQGRLGPYPNPVSWQGRLGPPRSPQGGFPFTASTGAAGPTSPTVPGAERGREAPSSSGWVTPSSPLYPVPAAVLSSLRQLSISTSILSDPARVPEQAARVVAALGRPGASSS